MVVNDDTGSLTARDGWETIATIRRPTDRGEITVVYRRQGKAAGAAGSEAAGR